MLLALVLKGQTQSGIKAVQLQTVTRSGIHKPLRADVILSPVPWVQCIQDFPHLKFSVCHHEPYTLQCTTDCQAQAF